MPLSQGQMIDFIARHDKPVPKKTVPDWIALEIQCYFY
jgi:hypothetical protein